jgi:hypothetical protein
LLHDLLILLYAVLILLRVEDAGCKKYHELLTRLSLQFPRFTKTLKPTTHSHQKNPGRAAVLEFREIEPKLKVEEFRDPDKLRQHLDNLAYPTPAHESGLYGRLWLLEDLSVDWITILGSRLLIPPQTFAAQWADPSGAEFNDRHSFDSNPEQRFLLKYTQFQEGTLSGVNGDRREPLARMKCNVERHVFCSGQEDTTYENPKFVRSYHNLSFWSKNPLSRCWDGKQYILPQPL